MIFVLSVFKGYFLQSVVSRLKHENGSLGKEDLVVEVSVHERLNRDLLVKVLAREQKNVCVKGLVLGLFLGIMQ